MSVFTRQANMNSFTPPFEALPLTLPIFPLPEAILLPNAKLPLNIFEPRYLNMTFDALRADRMIGMIQPNNSTQTASKQAIYKSGCAGRITSFTETDDGRLLIELTGVCRFDVAEEITTIRGYRRIVPDWQRFQRDMNEESSAEIDVTDLLEILRDYFEISSIQADWDALKKLPGHYLVNMLAMKLPFSVEEKQALVEATTPLARRDLLINITQMSLSDRGNLSPTRH